MAGTALRPAPKASPTPAPARAPALTPTLGGAAAGGKIAVPESDADKTLNFHRICQIVFDVAASALRAVFQDQFQTNYKTAFTTKSAAAARAHFKMMKHSEPHFLSGDIKQFDMTLLTAVVHGNAHTAALRDVRNRVVAHAHDTKLPKVAFDAAVGTVKAAVAALLPREAKNNELRIATICVGTIDPAERERYICALMEWARHEAESERKIEALEVTVRDGAAKTHTKLDAVLDGDAKSHTKLDAVAAAVANGNAKLDGMTNQLAAIEKRDDAKSLRTDPFARSSVGWPLTDRLDRVPACVVASKLADYRVAGAAAKASCVYFESKSKSAHESRREWLIDLMCQTVTRRNETSGGAGGGGAERASSGDDSKTATATIASSSNLIDSKLDHKHSAPSPHALVPVASFGGDAAAADTEPSDSQQLPLPAASKYRTSRATISIGSGRPPARLTGVVDDSEFLASRDRWISPDVGGSRFTVVYGPPGSGKSCALAELCLRPPAGPNAPLSIIGFHAAHVRSPCTLDLPNFTLSLVHALLTHAITRPAYEKWFGENPTALTELQSVKSSLSFDAAQSAFDAIVVAAFREFRMSAPPAPLCFVVDGLDEAKPEVVRAISQLIGVCPDWFRVIASSRRVPAVTDEFDADCKRAIAEIDLSNYVQKSREDVIAYFLRWIIQNPDSFLARASEDVQLSAVRQLAAGGNFLFAAFGLRSIRRAEDVADVHRIATSSGGDLSEIFKRPFERLFPKPTTAAAAVPFAGSLCDRVLSILIAAGSLWRDELNTLLWLHDDTIDERAVRTVCDELSTFIVSSADGGIELFHRSFAEWLSDKRNNPKYYVNLPFGERRLIAYTILRYRRDLSSELTSADRDALVAAVPITSPQNLWDQLIQLKLMPSRSYPHPSDGSRWPGCYHDDLIDLVSRIIGLGKEIPQPIALLRAIFRPESLQFHIPLMTSRLTNTHIGFAPVTYTIVDLYALAESAQSSKQWFLDALHAGEHALARRIVKFNPRTTDLTLTRHECERVLQCTALDMLPDLARWGVITDDGYRQALGTACEKDDAGFVRALIETFGPKYGCTGGLWGRNSATAMGRTCGYGSMRTLKYLVTLPPFAAELKNRSSHDDALSSACVRNQTRVVEYLVWKCGLNPNYVLTGGGWPITALEFACMRGALDVAMLFFHRREFDPLAPPPPRTGADWALNCFDIAVGYGHVELVRALTGTARVRWNRDGDPIEIARVWHSILDESRSGMEYWDFPPRYGPWNILGLIIEYALPEFIAPATATAIASTTSTAAPRS